MTALQRISISLLSVLLLLSVASCGGGGGGGGGGDGVTRDTALRIIHGALDETPVTIRIGTIAVQTASYGESTSYARVSDGATAIRVERANAESKLLNTINTTLLSATEYTVFVFGNVLAGSAGYTLIEDVVLRPDEGLANVRIFNGFEGSSRITASVGDVAVPGITRGSASDFFQLTAGPQTFTIKNASGGTLATITVALANRGETSILVTGDASLGVVFTKVFTDLD